MWIIFLCCIGLVFLLWLFYLLVRERIEIEAAKKIREAEWLAKEREKYQKWLAGKPTRERFQKMMMGMYDVPNSEK